MTSKFPFAYFERLTVSTQAGVPWQKRPIENSAHSYSLILIGNLITSETDGGSSENILYMISNVVVLIKK